MAQATRAPASAVSAMPTVVADRAACHRLGLGPQPSSTQRTAVKSHRSPTRPVTHIRNRVTGVATVTRGKLPNCISNPNQETIPRRPPRTRGLHRSRIAISTALWSVDAATISGREARMPVSTVERPNPKTIDQRPHRNAGAVHRMGLTSTGPSSSTETAAQGRTGWLRSHSQRGCRLRWVSSSMPSPCRVTIRNQAAIAMPITGRNTCGIRSELPKR